MTEMGGMSKAVYGAGWQAKRQGAAVRTAGSGNCRVTPSSLGVVAELWTEVGWGGRDGAGVQGDPLCPRRQHEAEPPFSAGAGRLLSWGHFTCSKSPGVRKGAGVRGRVPREQGPGPSPAQPSQM